MSESEGKKGFKIIGVDMQRGYIDVQYTFQKGDYEYDPIWLSVGIPDNLIEKEEDINKEEIVDLVKKHYPLEDFLKNRPKRETSDKPLPIFEKEEFFEVLDNELTKSDYNEQKGAGTGSFYGTDTDIIRTRHIIIDTLIELGLIK
jgi:hypothetical protein